MNMKVSNKCILLVLVFFYSQALLAQTRSSNKGQRPNIILFFVDDMGWQDSSVPFWSQKTPRNKQFHTPNMEILAQEGMKFTNAYAAPVCTPTRASILSGMNPAHLGITNWTSPTKNNNSDAADDLFLPSAWNINGLSPQPGIERTAVATPFPSLLKDAGYFTIHVGKAHWASAGTPGANPQNMGFMVNISGHAAGHPQSYYATDNFGNLPGKATVQAVPDLEEYFGIFQTARGQRSVLFDLQMALISESNLCNQISTNKRFHVHSKALCVECASLIELTPARNLLRAFMN